ncbi:Cupin domain protein [Bradyrhizobium erythrophlei]|nr:Cupin domain protein [Bradyrhizobium erythrophlei]
MIEFKQMRRSLMLGLAGLGIGQTLPLGQTAAQAAAPQGYVLGPDGGDHLVHFRNPGNIFIKVDPVKGSGNLALGTQQVPIGAGIPIHRHFEMDEAFYVLEGGGTFVLNDQPHPFEKGGTIFIPKTAWHGFANPDHELLLLWIVTPPGLDGFSEKPAIRPACRESSSPRTRSTRLLANMRRNSADRAPSFRYPSVRIGASLLFARSSS